MTTTPSPDPRDQPHHCHQCGEVFTLAAASAYNPHGQLASHSRSQHGSLGFPSCVDTCYWHERRPDAAPVTPQPRARARRALVGRTLFRCWSCETVAYSRESKPENWTVATRNGVNRYQCVECSDRAESAYIANHEHQTPAEEAAETAFWAAQPITISFEVTFDPTGAEIIGSANAGSWCVGIEDGRWFVAPSGLGATLIDVASRDAGISLCLSEMAKTAVTGEEMGPTGD